MLVKLFYFANALLMRRKKRPVDQAAIDSKNFLEMEGEVLELLPAGAFKIVLSGGNEVLAHLSGKMRMHKIRLAPGDRVRMEISPYDLTKGRITYRL